MLDIVIPAFRGGDYLAAAIRSVIQQTSPDWRLHVIDDASPFPGMSELVTGFGDRRIVYSRNENNIGVSAQFNLALSTGDAGHMVIMGEDDQLLPHYVERMSQVLARHPDAAVIQPGVEVIDADGRAVMPLADRVKKLIAPRPTEMTSFRGDRITASLMRGDWCYFPSICWKRETVRAIGFRPEYEVVQDLGLLVELLAEGYEMVVDPLPSFRYRRHQASLSSERAVDGGRFEEEGRYFALVASDLERRGMPQAARAARWHVTSRLHAIVLMPQAVRHRDRSAIRALIRHTAR